jgi:PBSX family phage terminase large subunit
MKDEEQREQIRSIGQDGGLDRAWLEEATGFIEADFNEILARMRGTASPYCQVILSTNPGAPTHWIKERLIDKGQAHAYYSSALDNLHNPPEYITTLQQMTGLQGMRLRDGKWVMSEGAVYDNWDMENVTVDAEYNADLPMFWGVDDGYSAGQGIGTASYHPRVILFMQPLPNGGVHVVDEYYATGELSETSIANAFAKPYKKPEGAYVDSSAAEFKGRLWQAGIMTVGATHPVHEGIKVMRDLILDANGVRLFRIHPRCANLNREMASYRYDDASRVANVGEPKPMKVDDHGADAARYFCFHLRYGR